MMEELERLLGQAFALERQREELTAGLRIRKADLENQLAVVEAEITGAAPNYDVELAVLREQISKLALARAKSFRCPWGSIRYTKGYDKVTYDNKALDVVWKTDPKSSWLGLHRKEKPVSPRVTVEIFREQQAD